MRAYEIHTYRDGVWKVDSVFDDKDLAIFEARRVEEGSRYAGVKVIEEYYDEASDLTTTRTLFRGGAAKARRPLPEKPKPKPGRGVPRGSAGREPVRKSRGRQQKNQSSNLVLVLVTLVILLGGITLMLGLRYLSALK